MMLHDMSREFWHLLGIVLLIAAVVAPMLGWYLDVDHAALVGFSILCVIGAGYMLQLGNASDSREDRVE
jgi:hypothetical protein